MITEPLQWFFAALGALMIGISKAGIPGISILSIALFNFLFVSAKQTSGLILPMLVFGDIVAVIAYRRHTQWSFLWKLFPWTALGVVLGYLALGRISDHTARVMIGLIIVGLAAMSYGRRYARKPDAQGAMTPHWSIAALTGVVAGFITLIANAAGPLMAIYLVAMRLPKMQFVGTAAVFFMLLNLFKVPFMIDLGLITRESFAINSLLAPAVLLGVWGGRVLLARINQRLFEQLVLILSAVGGLLLLL